MNLRGYEKGAWGGDWWERTWEGLNIGKESRKRCVYTLVKIKNINQNPDVV